MEVQSGLHEDKRLAVALGLQNGDFCSIGDNARSLASQIPAYRLCTTWRPALDCQMGDGRLSSVSKQSSVSS